MEVSYKVDKENKVVVCFGKDTAFDVLDDLKSSYDETTPLEALSPFMIRDMFVAKVKCDERDEFDEFVGKKLAYKRMMAKYIDAKQKIQKKQRNNVNSVSSNNYCVINFSTE